MKMYEKLQTLAENIKIEEYRLLSLAKTLNKYQSYFTGAIYKDTDINNMVKKLQAFTTFTLFSNIFYN